MRVVRGSRSGPTQRTQPLKSGSLWACCPSHGQDPGASRAGETAADEVAQVEDGGAAFEPGVVLCATAITEFEASAAEAGDLGDDPFHVGPERSVLLAQFGVGSPVPSGLAEQVVSLVQNEFAAGLGCGAPPPQRAVAAERAEGGDTGSADRTGDV